jgi:hypothetical protein
MFSSVCRSMSVRGTPSIAVRAGSTGVVVTRCPFRGSSSATSRPGLLDDSVDLRGRAAHGAVQRGADGDRAEPAVGAISGNPYSSDRAEFFGPDVGMVRHRG